MERPASSTERTRTSVRQVADALEARLGGESLLATEEASRDDAAVRDRANLLAKPVRDAIADVEAQSWSKIRTDRTAEVNAAVERAVEAVRGYAAKVPVTAFMRDRATQQARVCWEHEDAASMEERARQVFLTEIALETARQQAVDSGECVILRHPTLYGDRDDEAANLGEARMVIANFADFDRMVSSAFRILTSSTASYVVSVNSYKTAGCDLIISMSTLAEEFEMKVAKGTSVAELARTIQQDRRPMKVGSQLVEVKMISPSGKLLEASKKFPAVLDLDGEDLSVDAESGTFFPLSVLTGEEWRTLGLDGATRWKHLRENEFAELFGMTKAAFEKSPSWKQIPLRKKHGLF